MGASNPHPHGQIWAQYSIPHIVQRKLTQQGGYYQRHHGATLLLDYARREQQYGQRLLYANDSFVWLVPFWACWPFETMILPRRYCMTGPSEMSREEKHDLADILKVSIGSYDRIFDVPFPYSMGLHLPPTAPESSEGWQFHISFYPPLLRSATVRKFMVGYELCAMPQRDVTPEQAAELLGIAKQRYQSEGPAVVAGLAVSEMDTQSSGNRS